MVTYADFIMAHARLEIIIQHTVTVEWVMGHASEKTKNAPKTITDLERDISRCNLDIEQCIQQGGPPFNREDLHPSLSLIPASKRS